MPNYRRSDVAGGTFFFTVVTENRADFLCTAPARRLLGRIIRECRGRWPMQVDAFVLLPDHLHTIWTLPSGDRHFSKRWAWVKKEFTKTWLASGHLEEPVTEGRRRDGRRGVWQPKFWEHTVRDERDFEAHMGYIHYNPVKHGLVSCPHGWKWSSFHRLVREGVYPAEWGCRCAGKVHRPPDFSDIEGTVGE